MDNIIRRMSGQIYTYVTKYLPWGYTDERNNTTIDVLKTTTGIRVVMTHLDDNEDCILTTDIPQSEIERLMSQ